MSSPADIARIMVPRVPMILKNALWHTFSLSDTSSKWDLRTELTVTTLRSILSGSTSSISKQQRLSTHDPGVKGPLWVATSTIPVPPEDDLRQLLFTAIAQLDPTGTATFTPPAAVPVEGEWTGHRAGVSKDAPPPPGTAASHYASLTAEATSPLVMLFFHGGAYYLCDPASHRPLVGRLCRDTGGRAFSVRYRLAPQHPFPAALLDCLTAYLALLYPPPGSLHEPVRPEHVVFSGDSAGGNMVLALLQLLLHLRRTGGDSTTVQFNGKQVPLPLPAAVATSSAWTDVTRCMPSLYTNAHWDYLPLPSMPFQPTANSKSIPGQIAAQKQKARKIPDPFTPNPPPCAIWPVSPPRADMYCEGSLLCHPLVSPLAVTSEGWKGAPPMYFCVGEEMLLDEVQVVAQRAAQAGASVRFEGFEAMPHDFVMMLQDLAGSERCLRGWTGFMKDAVRGEVSAGAVWVKAKSLEEIKIDFAELSGFDEDEVRSRMEAEKERRIRLLADASAKA